MEYAWSQTEPALAILCACLTTYRPLLRGVHLKAPKLSFAPYSSRHTERYDYRGMVSDWTDMENTRTSQLRFPVARDFEGQRGGYSQPSRSFREIPLEPVNGGLHVLDVGNVRCAAPPIDIDHRDTREPKDVSQQGPERSAPIIVVRKTNNPVTINLF